MFSRQTILFVLTFSFAYNFAEDRCSSFEGSYPNHSLVECPQAKFMVKDNLFECYDKKYKEVGKYKQLPTYIESNFSLDMM